MLCVRCQDNVLQPGRCVSATMVWSRVPRRPDRDTGGYTGWHRLRRGNPSRQPLNTPTLPVTCSACLATCAAAPARLLRRRDHTNVANAATPERRSSAFRTVSAIGAPALRRRAGLRWCDVVGDRARRQHAGPHDRPHARSVGQSHRVGRLASGHRQGARSGGLVLRALHLQRQQPSGRHRELRHRRQRSGDEPLPSNTWSHLALTYDGATLRIFVNGRLASAQPANGLLATAGTPLRIWWRFNLGGIFFGADRRSAHLQPAADGQ